MHVPRNGWGRGAGLSKIVNKAPEPKKELTGVRKLAAMVQDLEFATSRVSSGMKMICTGLTGQLDEALPDCQFAKQICQSMIIFLRVFINHPVAIKYRYYL